MARADIHATGKSDAAIDQQQLAVIAQVEMQRGRPQAQRIETRNVNAGLFQATTDPWPRIALASVVDQHLDLHATRLGLRQRGDKLLADCVVVADVSAKPDRSEEHTSELQSLMRISYAVFCLKKK